MCQVSRGEGLVDHDRARPKVGKAVGIPCDEDMRNKPRAKDLNDCGYSAALTQVRVNDHQIGMMPCCGGHRFELGLGNRANRMTYLRQKLGHSHGDDRIVLNHEYFR